MDAITHLQKDRKLARIIDRSGPHRLSHRKNIHLELVASIISQQLSTKVAAVIHGRFMALFRKKAPTCSDILALTFEQLRSIGLSNAKATYVQNVCRFFIEEKITDAKLMKMDDESLISYLTRIKGVGRWTSEMILMFSMGRPDVMALDDLGIQQAMIKLYKLEASDKKKLRADMIRISDKWRPFRTYACRYLWGWKDGG